MKVRHLIFSLLAIASLFAGCAKTDVVENARMKLSVSEMAFERIPAEGQVVVVTSNRKWKVKDLPEWVTVSVGGKDIENEVMPVGETKVTITLSENAGEDRDYQLLFNGGNVANKTLKITQLGIPVVYDNISDIKALLGGGSSVTLAEGKKIKGTVVSNVNLSNQTSNRNITVQDSTGGIAIRLAEKCTYSFGDVIAIDLSNQELTTYNKAIQLNNIPITNIKVKDTATVVKPIEADITKFLNNEYEGCYISIDRVEVADAHLSNTWVKYSGSDSSHTSINVIVETGEAFVVFSSKYATYGRQTVAQGAGTICGVSSRNNDDIQLIFGQTSDWEELTGERFEAYSEECTVDEALEKAANKDVTIHGRVIKVVKDGFILNDGTQNSIYAYNGNKIEYSITENALVEVRGNISIYGATEIIPYRVGPTEKTIAPTPTLKVNELTPAQIAKYSGKASVIVSFKGLFSYDSSGPFYNIALDGQTIQGSLKVLDGVDITGFNGENVIVTGFYVGSSSKYFNVAITSADDIDNSYITVDPASTKIKADSTMVKFNVASNKPWTITAPEGYTVDPTSGEGDAEVTVTFSKNTDTSKEKEGIIKVTTTSGKVKETTFKITQEKAFDANRVTLTQEEIIAGMKDTYKVSKKSGFQDVTIVGAATGTWTGYANFAVASGAVSSDYVQINNKPRAGLKSPTFKSKISKIAVNLNSKTTATKITLIAIPATTDLSKITTTTYSLSSFPTQYGSVEVLKGIPATAEIKITGDIQDYIIVSVGGTAYINSIDTYLK